MSWSFRRLRNESLSVILALAGVALLAGVTGRAMHDTYESSGLADCLANAAAFSDCEELSNAFGEKFSSMQLLIVPLVLLPALFGAFIGAPLVAREVEAGTHRFFWTQSATRERWLATTTAAVLVLALVAGAAYALIAAVWLDVTNTVTDERFANLYDLQGVVPVAATVMAAAFGVCASVVLRRTLPAMGATIAAFIGVRVALALLARPHFMAPVVARLPFQRDDPFAGTGAWILSRSTVDPTGTTFGAHGGLEVTKLFGRCPSLPAAPAGLPGADLVEACLRELDVHTLITYQPGDRFWTFQFIESGIMVGLAALALGLAFIALRRRIN